MNSGRGSGENEEDRENIILAYKLREAANAARDKINLALANYKELTDLCYLTKDRTKEHARIIEKVNRKINANSKLLGGTNIDRAYGPEDVTDVCGFRFVTYYQNGVAEVVRHILRLICHECDPVQSPLIRNSLQDVIIFTTRPDKDPLSIVAEVKKVVKDSTLPVVPTVMTLETGYSSVHVVAQCATGLKEPDFDKIWVEFQVRSAFEEVWGEVDHKLRYGLHRGTADMQKWHMHLNALKTLVDGCIQYLHLIRMDADQEQSLARDSDTTKRAMRSSEYILSRLSAAPPDILSAFERAYSSRKEAVAARTERESQRLFAETAKAFRSILENERSFIASKEDVAREVYYWVQMELAYCLMNTGDQESLDEAIQIYKDVESTEPEDGVSRFRHSQALSRLREYSEAIKLAQTAKDILDNGRDRRVDARHRVHAAVRRNLGYIYWQMSEERPETPEDVQQRLADLREAITFTQQGLARANDGDEDLRDEYRRNLNNLVYYSWQERRIVADNAQPTLSEEEFNDRTYELKKEIDISSKPNYGFLDTLMRSLDKIGDNAAACNVAQRLKTLMDDKISEEMGGKSVGTRGETLERAQRYLKANEYESYSFAMSLLVDSARPQPSQ